MKIAEPTKWTTLNIAELHEEVEDRSFPEQGIFFALVGYMLSTGKGFPDDIREIACMIRITSDNESEALRTILRWHFKLGQNRGQFYYYHPAVRSAMIKAADAVARKRENGRKGGQKTQHRRRQNSNVIKLK